MEKVIGIIPANYTTGDMRGMTRTRTIASLPFGASYRMIDFPLSNMVNSGIKSVGVITPMHCRSLLDHIGFGKNWQLDCKVGGLFFLPESIERANRSARNFFLSDMKENREFLTRSPAPYAVFSSCHYVYNLDYQPILRQMREQDADIMLICGEHVRNDSNCRGVKLDKEGRVIGLSARKEEGELAFIGSFIIRRELLLRVVEQYDEYNPRNVFELIARDLPELKISSYLHTGYAGCIVSVLDYFRCSQDLLASVKIRHDLFDTGRQIHTKIYDSVPSRFHPEAKMRNSIISSGVDIRGSVENSVIFRSVSIGEGARVRNSIIMPGAVIGRDTVVENAIIDKHVEISDGVLLRGAPKHPIIGGRDHNSF